MKHYFGIAEDKWKHFGVSAAIVFVFYALIQSIAIASAISLIIGILKELYDDTKPRGSADVYDILADAAGIVCADVLIIIARSII
jgi:hypothetical protein